MIGLNQLILMFVSPAIMAMFAIVAALIPMRPTDESRQQTAVVEPSDWFGIQVVDGETGRGVPLVRLHTSAQVEYWTDSNGWVAFLEPGLMNQEVHFTIEAPGYTYPADGFGFRGVRLRTIPGNRVEIKLKRTQLAERLYRITGSGIYRDSTLLGAPAPDKSSRFNGGVMGQDSVQMVAFQGQYFWLWGDTNLAHYPLGNFHVTAAESPLIGELGFDPDLTIPLQYLTNEATGMVEKMLPDDQPGVVWLWGLINVPDEQGNETLLAHYSRHLKLGEMVEQGIAEWDNSARRFVKVQPIPLAFEWQVPRGQAVRSVQGEQDYIYFAEPFAMTRVAATRSAVLAPEQYEALAWDPTLEQYRWQRTWAPTSQRDEAKQVAEGILPLDHARYQITDWERGEPIEMHRGSVQWNEYRQRWVLIACQANHQGQPSFLGEIWYAESESIDGPWREAIKIATHPNYSFYNPRHHQLFDRDGGRTIYFEGTYTQMFSGNPRPTPRYDYNQIMYRLDLSRLPWIDQVDR
ncbi:MAG TPA: hypothetical protein PKD54_02615 [Pirellulaceae bacterium]|nr:hypothetical protein [Pirellulaceae bacterium]